MKKFLLLIVLVVAVFAAYTVFFSSDFDRALQDLRTLERQVNVGESFLLPGTKSDLSTYKSGLLSLKKKWFASRPFTQLVDLKLSLVQTEERVFFLADEFVKINRISPNCSATGEIAVLKSTTEEIKTGYNSALSKRNLFVRAFPQEAEKAEEVSSETFAQTMNGSVEGVERINQILDSYCF